MQFLGVEYWVTCGGKPVEGMMFLCELKSIYLSLSLLGIQNQKNNNQMKLIVTAGFGLTTHAVKKIHCKRAPLVTE